jgi:hypothetical protein
MARIVAVADAFDAMTSHRPYHENKRGRPPAAAFDEVARQAGRQFDPRCAAAFLEIQDQVLRTMCELMPEAGTSSLQALGVPTMIGLPSPTTTPAPMTMDGSGLENSLG